MMLDSTSMYRQQKKGNIEEGKKFEGFMSQQVSKGDKKVGKVRTACTSIE